MGHDDESSSHRATFDKIRDILLRIDRWMTHLGAAPLVLYNCHIVWSCRALEEEYNLHQSRWNYARILLSWGILASVTELALHQILIRCLDQVVPRSSSAATDPLASLRTKLLVRPLSTTPTTLTATMLLIFHLQYPFVAPQILPWLKNWQFLSPSVSYFLCISILMLVSPQSLTGGLVGLFWWYTEFLLQPYWNIPFCGAFVVLTCLSARVEYGNDLVPWIDRVAWNANGTLLVPNDQGEWVPFMEEAESNDENSSVSTQGSDEDEEERMGLRIPDDNVDVESADRRGWTELVPLSSDWATQMRSRRGASFL
ncbi:hypothetical protein FisN_14Hh242 [Fistulifera solaris]|uniref:Uncharacterized protein n=1 Tax=Fistulifera solaris TaxID=1519565 RepID=A0A1Z5K8N2_FISSO|nr:hypothetical protein FisN_14Hh242 [Fistulifera solaris]|eukprot:GAX22609.1 hypothetical protein FisN_14Hh242 [Fistulifera solaris]